MMSLQNQSASNLLSHRKTIKLTLCVCSSLFWGVYVHTGEFPIALHYIHLQSLVRAGKMKLFNHLHLQKNTFKKQQKNTSSLPF